MSNESEETKGRMDKAMSDMKELQRKFNDMSPEQRKELAQRLKGNESELRGLLAQLGSAYAAAKSRQKSSPERVAKTIAENAEFTSTFRAQKSKRDIADLWCDGWLIPLAVFGKRTSLQNGNGIKKFWHEILEIVPEKNETLIAIVDAWNKAPAIALPALLTQLSSLLLDHFGSHLENRILPFNLTSIILLRLVIEIQIQAGLDPSDTKELEAVLNDWTLVAAGESPTKDLKDLTLKGMLAFGWLASILASTKKN